MKGPTVVNNDQAGLDIADEFESVNLGGLRLNRRLLKIATDLAGCPTKIDSHYAPGCSHGKSDCDKVCSNVAMQFSGEPGPRRGIPGRPHVTTDNSKR